MATTYWLGGNSTNEEDFATAANWSGAAVPADGDTIVFSSRAGISDGTGDSTVGRHWSCLDNLYQGTKGFTIIIAPDFTGNIGSEDAGTVSGLICNADFILAQGSGNYYIVSCDSTSSDGIELIICDGSNTNLYLGKDSTDGQHITTIIGVRGDVLVMGSGWTGLTAPELVNVFSVGNSFRITIEEGNTGALSIELTKGIVTTNSGYTQAKISGGTFTVGDENFTPSSMLTLANTQVYDGNCQIRAESKVSEASIYGGEMKLVGSQTKQIGDSADIIAVYGGVLDMASEQSGVVTIQATSDVTLYSPSGVFIPPINKAIDW